MGVGEGIFCMGRGGWTFFMGEWGCGGVGRHFFIGEWEWVGVSGDIF